MKSSNLSQRAQEKKTEEALYDMIKENTRNAYIIMFLACCDELHVGKKRAKRVQESFDKWQDQIQTWIKDDVLDEKLNASLKHTGLSIKDFAIQESTNDIKSRARHSKKEITCKDERFCRESSKNFSSIAEMYARKENNT